MTVFLVNKVKQVFVCAVASVFSEMVAYLTSGYLMDYFGPKKTYVGSFTLAFIGGLLILALGRDLQGNWSFVLVVLLAKFGIVMASCMNYAAHPLLYPTLFSTTSMGYLLMITYTFSSVSQYLTEIDEPFPMILFTCFSAIGAVAAFFLRTLQDEPASKQKKGVEGEISHSQESLKHGLFQDE